MADFDRVHADFSAKVKHLRVASKQNADALRLEEQPAWFYPHDGWQGDVLEIAGLNDAFSRAGVNRDYEACLNAQPPGSGGTAASLKIQVDYAAAVERAYRTRHASPVRCALHAAARLAGHGHAQGPLEAAADYASDLIHRGQNG